MKVIVVGLGIQGYKRKRVAGKDCVASVDPANKEAEYRSIEEVPLSSYDAALVCIPDEPKIEVLTYFLTHGKHVLVEKPLWAEKGEQIKHLEKLAHAKGLVCYTAYNHRFEPHYVHMRDLIASGKLGIIYHCRMFYGNGTARLARDSVWRDQGSGVLPDLGSHLLDTAKFWFGDLGEDFQIVSAHCFENRAPDHVVVVSKTIQPALEFEMTLLSWRNHFTCDLIAENGSAHISSLCKWGPTTFTYRKRILPSGYPPEESTTLCQDDPTWALEFEHFKSMCEGGAITNLGNDLWLNRLLEKLSKASIERTI